MFLPSPSQALCHMAAAPSGAVFVEETGVEQEQEQLETGAGRAAAKRGRKLFEGMSEDLSQYIASVDTMIPTSNILIDTLLEYEQIRQLNIAEAQRRLEFVAAPLQELIQLLVWPKDVIGVFASHSPCLFVGLAILELMALVMAFCIQKWVDVSIAL